MINYRCDQAILLLFHFRILNTYNAMYIKTTTWTSFLSLFCAYRYPELLDKRETFPYQTWFVSWQYWWFIKKKMVNLSPFCLQPEPLHHTCLQQHILVYWLTLTLKVIRNNTPLFQFTSGQEATISNILYLYKNNTDLQLFHQGISVKAAQY